MIVVLLQSKNSRNGKERVENLPHLYHIKKKFYHIKKTFYHTYHILLLLLLNHRTFAPSIRQIDVWLAVLLVYAHTYIC